MEKTYHLVSALIAIEQREQGDQLVVRDIVDHMLAAACADATASSRRAINVKSTVLESVRLIEDDAPAPMETLKNDR